MRPYDSLREKLVQPFVLLGFIVSTTLGLSTFSLLAYIEERAVVRTLNVELESFRRRLAFNPDALPADSQLLKGVFLPSELLAAYRPSVSKTARAEMRTVGDKDYSLLLAEVDGRPFALMYDRSYIKSNLAQLAMILLLAAGGMTLLSYLVGAWLARRVVQPIVRLMGDVSIRAAQRELPTRGLGFSATAYPRDEIGQLVRELDRFSQRLCAFIERESYFAADVSHELRTPVTVIAGAAEVLADLEDLPVSVRQRIETIRRQALRMSQILEAMLLLATEEGEGGDPVCALAEVVVDVVADIMPTLSGSPIGIETCFLGRPIISVERALAYVLISNVLRNACAHAREGVVGVTLEAHALDVVDKGEGIPEERFPELFKRHAKGEQSDGHGLGLSIVARIAERLGWRITVESRVGVGTRFRFEFADEPPDGIGGK